MLLKKQITALIPLFVIVAGLLSYNFMNAQWQNPTATAPNNNTSAPLNVSASYQAKLGDLGAVRMRAGQYCNADGTICTAGAALAGGGGGGALKQHAWGVFNGGTLRYQQGVVSVVQSGTAWVVTLSSAPTGDTNYIITGEIGSNAQGLFSPISPTSFSVQARSSNLNNFLAGAFTFIMWDPT